MSALHAPRAVEERFDMIVSRVASRGRGLSFAELGDAFALAMTVEAPTANSERERIAELSVRLGIEPPEV